jgi:hypothetical protein
MSNNVNSDAMDLAPFVAPDESYLIFASARSGGYGGTDLYISFSDGEGEWAPAINMGSAINTSANQGAPSVSADGAYLFFQSDAQPYGRNPYWVDAAILEQLNHPYLGQAPPGMEPVRFPPVGYRATAEWFWHGSPAFSVNGDEMYFAQMSHDGGLWLRYTRVVDGDWIPHENPSFASEYAENNPMFAVDDPNRLYFISQRPGGHIFTTTRPNHRGEWAVPTAVDIAFPDSTTPGWQFCLNRDGDVYFEGWINNQPDLYVSRLVDGLYTQPVRLSDHINSGYNDFSPYVEPDERYLIFVSNRPGFGFHDLYISFKLTDGTWSQAVNLGTGINDDFEDTSPVVTQDGNYFFFVTQKAGDQGYTPYWVDSEVLEQFDPASGG